ncbi:MAG: hypothetical protein AAFY70_04050, partial [Bacteroidota bacterium]
PFVRIGQVEFGNRRRYSVTQHVVIGHRKGGEAPGDRHCHIPGAWEASAERDFDFRYETPFDQTGILFERDRIEEALRDQEMPFIGTTLLDQEGVDLVIAYMESL